MVGNTALRDHVVGEQGVQEGLSLVSMGNVQTAQDEGSQQRQEP